MVTSAAAACGLRRRSPRKRWSDLKRLPILSARCAAARCDALSIEPKPTSSSVCRHSTALSSSDLSDDASPGRTAGPRARARRRWGRQSQRGQPSKWRTGHRAGASCRARSALARGKTQPRCARARAPRRTDDDAAALARRAQAVERVLREELRALALQHEDGPREHAGQALAQQRACESGWSPGDVRGSGRVAVGASG